MGSLPKIKIAFFDVKNYDRESFNAANKDFGFEITYFDSRLSKDTVDLAKGSNVVCAFVNDEISKEVVARLLDNKIELITLRCTGYNNVDLKATHGKIHVLRVPEYSPHAVAEFSLALMLCLNRKIHKAYNRVREGNFSIDKLMGFDLYGKTIGIIGTGKIGRCLVNIVKGLGMKVLAYDAFPDQKFAAEAGFNYVGLAELYQNSDIISLHCPLTKETEHMINESTIAKMKNGVMIINTSRGKIVDTAALIEGLKSGHIGYAGLDVYEEESEYFFEDLSATPISDDVLTRLFTLPNVIVTSHQAFFTEEAITNIAHTTLENIRDYFAGGYLPNEICYQCGQPCIKKLRKRCF